MLGTYENKQKKYEILECFHFNKQTTETPKKISKKSKLLTLEVVWCVSHIFEQQFYFLFSVVSLNDKVIRFVSSLVAFVHRFFADLSCCDCHFAVCMCGVHKNPSSDEILLNFLVVFHIDICWWCHVLLWFFCEINSIFVVLN